MTKARIENLRTNSHLRLALRSVGHRSADIHAPGLRVRAVLACPEARRVDPELRRAARQKNESIMKSLSSRFAPRLAGCRPEANSQLG